MESNLAMSPQSASRCSLVVLIVLSVFPFFQTTTAAEPNEQSRFVTRADDSPFGSDWQILSSNIFFGGAQGLFGLSPASLLRRSPLLIESSADGTVAAETSAPNETFLSSPNERFLSLISSDSLFVGPRSSAQNATRLSGATPLLPAAPLVDSPALVWDGGSGTGTTWQNNLNWVGDTGPPTSSQVAQFGSAGTSPVIAIDMTGFFITNHGLANQIVGAIELLSGTRTIESMGNGTLTLNSATMNGVANVILRNASAGQLTLQFPPYALDVALGSATDNVILIDGSGGITIGSVIKDTVLAPGFVAKHITLDGGGTGALVLTGNNTYTGGTTIAAGTVQITSATSLGNESGTAVIGNGTLQATANITTTRNFQLSNANSRISVDAGRTFTISGTLSDGATAGTLNKNGTGTLSLTGTANTFTGGVNVNAGTLTAAVGSLVNIGGTITVNTGGPLMMFG